jgi:hypothetical protein
MPEKKRITMTGTAIIEEAHTPTGFLRVRDVARHSFAPG